MAPPAVLAALPEPPETVNAPAFPAGRALVPFVPFAPPAVAGYPPPALADGNDTGFRDLQLDANVRSMTPRQMADVSMDLYAAGALSWEEYAMLAFQPELHPDYERTVGALLGEKAAPDKRRDFVTEWERRLSFEKRYNKDRPHMIERTQHIVNILTMLDVRARLLNIA